MGLRLACINVHMFYEHERVLPFLAAQSPDIACLQEVCEEDMLRYAAAFGAREYRFVPMTRQWTDGQTPVIGVGIASRLPVRQWRTLYYWGEEGTVPDSDERDSKTFEQKHHMLLGADIEHEAQTLRIFTTHFPWTPDGSASDVQRRSMGAMLELLAGYDGFVLCGDFNAPRAPGGEPGEIFGMLAAKYRDNIPPQYLTSIDIERHRAGKDRPHELADKMVDGLFSTPDIAVSDVALHTGVSDHMAVTASVAISASAAHVELS